LSGLTQTARAREGSSGRALKCIESTGCEVRTDLAQRLRRHEVRESSLAVEWLETKTHKGPEAASKSRVCNRVRTND